MEKKLSETQSRAEKHKQPNHCPHYIPWIPHKFIRMIQLCLKGKPGPNFCLFLKTFLNKILIPKVPSSVSGLMLPPDACLIADLCSSLVMQTWCSWSMLKHGKRRRKIRPQTWTWNEGRGSRSGVGGNPDYVQAEMTEKSELTVSQNCKAPSVSLLLQ